MTSILLRGQSFIHGMPKIQQAAVLAPGAELITASKWMAASQPTVAECARAGPTTFLAGTKFVWRAQPEIRHHQDAEDCVDNDPGLADLKDLTARLFSEVFALDEAPRTWVFLQTPRLRHLDRRSGKRILSVCRLQHAVPSTPTGGVQIHAIVADAETVAACDRRFRLPKSSNFAADDCCAGPAKFARFATAVPSHPASSDAAGPVKMI